MSAEPPTPESLGIDPTKDGWFTEYERRRPRFVELDVERPVALALRRLQLLDELAELDGHRYLLIRAETALGEELGLACTGSPSILAEDGSVDGYDHSGTTCPIHEWLVESDSPDYEAGQP